MFRKIADNTSANSWSNRFRGKRQQMFLNFVNKLNLKSVLDIGGTQEYWRVHNEKNHHLNIVLLNLREENVTSNNFISRVGDATDLKEFADGAFDVVFSNSVIEHLYTQANQIKMANEVRRVGRNYFIQTPNKCFPIEPHYLFFCFQFLPNSLKISLLQNFPLGHVGRIKNKADAQNQIDEIRLLNKKELKNLFPDSTIFEEKFLWFTKSFIAYKFEKE